MITHIVAGPSKYNPVCFAWQPRQFLAEMVILRGYFLAKIQRKKKKVNAFEYSFLSYLVLLCLSPLGGENAGTRVELTKSLYVTLNNWTQGNFASS